MKPGWYRVEVDAAGKVLRCRRVKVRPKNPGCLYQRLRIRERRQRYREQGLCRCGREIDDPEFEKCSKCRASCKRSRDRRAGKLPPLAPGEKRARQIERQAESARLTVLLEAAGRLMALRDVRAFRAWLGDEIRKAGGKEQAA